MRYVSPGVDLSAGIGRVDDGESLDEQQHYIFPVLAGGFSGGGLPDEIEYSVGPGFGLTRGSDRVIVKFNLELERFIGRVPVDRIRTAPISLARYSVRAAHQCEFSGSQGARAAGLGFVSAPSLWLMLLHVEG